MPTTSEQDRYEETRSLQASKYKEAWDTAPAAFKRRAGQLGLKPDIEKKNGAAMPFDENYLTSSYMPDMAATLDTHIDQIVERHGYQNEALIRAVAEDLKKPMEIEIERSRAITLGRIVGQLINSDKKNITARLHGLTHAIPRLNIVFGFPSLRSSCRAAGCSVEWLSRTRDFWCDLLGLPIPEGGSKSAEAREKYPRGGENKSLAEPQICSYINHNQPHQTNHTMPKSTAPSTGGVDQIELALCTIHEGDAPVPAFTLSDASPSGIVIPDDLSYEEWRDGLKMFKWAQNKLKLGFSAYLTFGQLKFGAAKVNQDLAQLEFEMPVVTQAIEIASVPPEIRHDNLEAEHYVVIARAGLKPPQQKKWAKTASEQNLTPVQLKASIAAGEVVSTAVARHQHHGIANILGVRAEFDAWLRRVNGEAGIRKMPAAERKMIVDELEPMAKLHAALVKEPSKKARKAKKRAKK